MLYAYLETYGCQMNNADSDMLSNLLQARGYTITDDADTADLLVVNTCSVRQNAEDKAKARTSEFIGRRKRLNSSQLIWVIGCMAERMGDDLKKEIPGVDRVIGAQTMERLPELIDDMLAEQLHGDTTEGRPKTGLATFLPIMRGCDNFCTYCIVPHVRGREHSVPLAELVADAQRMVDCGTREITLLGQNVNSYRDGTVDFAQLLRSIHAEVPDLARIRFTTSHPKDLSHELIAAIAELPRVCKHVHLPVQSGNNRVLKDMNRKYTVEHYRGLLQSIRSAIPGVDITTDVMVGFPGETDAEYEQTLALFQELRYTSAFMFIYSPREGTAAATMGDQVPEKVKKLRLSKLIDIQTAITKDYYHSMVGTTLPVLFTDKQSRRSGSFIGFDDHFKKVLVKSDENLAGRIVPVLIRETTGMTLVGDLA